MEKLNLSTIPPYHIQQILKKLNDISYVRTLQTCKSFYRVSLAMEKWTRIQTTAFLPIFVYFDIEEGKVMYDVMEGYGIPDDSFGQNSYESMDCSYEEEDSDVDDNLHLQDSESDDSYTSMPEIVREEELNYICKELHETSHSNLSIAVSNRTKSFHKKMKRDDVITILEHFSFRYLTINLINLEPDFVQSIPQEVVVSSMKEIIELLPSLRANILKLEDTGTEEVFYKIMEIADNNFFFKGLHIQNNEKFSKLETLQYSNWYKLDEVIAASDKKPLVQLISNFIECWRAGDTNVTELRLVIDDDSRLDIQALGFSFLMNLQMEGQVSSDVYYLKEVVQNQARVALMVSLSNVLCFHDITTCSDCACSIGFCFKKMADVCAEFKTSKKFGGRDLCRVLNEWNGGTMERLAELLNYSFIPTPKNVF